MRSYILAVAVAMLLSAVYAFQNTTEITVRFLMLQRTFPQGVWEVILFSIGAVLMWFFSILASFEVHSTHKKQLKERDKRVADLEEEKNALLAAFKHIAPHSDPLAKPADGVSEEAPRSPEAEVDTALKLDETEEELAKTVEPQFEEPQADELDEQDQKDDEEKESSYV